MSEVAKHILRDEPGKSSLYSHLSADPLEVRLLQVEPNDDFYAPIVCRLQTYELSSAPAYRCVSYAWGLPDLETIVLVNGVQVKTTRNLSGFLQRIREKSAPNMYYWIDAISINQSDKTERSCHVAEMGRIYQKAQMVIGWLGWEEDRLGNGSDIQHSEWEADETGGLSHRGIVFLRKLAQAFRNWTQAGGLAWPPSTQLSKYAFDDADMYRILDIKPPPFATWESLGWLLTRAWFQRAWIVQEATLAKNLVLVCGFRDIYWDDFVQVSIFLHASGWFHGLMRLMHSPTSIVIPAGRNVLFFATLQNIAGQIHRTDIPQAIFNIPDFGTLDQSTNAADVLQFFIANTLPFQASDARDKIYAPLALVSAAFPKLHRGTPKVDYAADLEHIFEKYAGYLLERSSSLDLLSFVGDPSGKQKPTAESLPSWVPNFAETGHSAFAGIPGIRYNPLPGHQKICIWHRETAELEVEGTCVSVVGKFGPSFSSLYNGGDFRPLIEFMLNMDNDKSTVVTARGIDALWRTLIGDCDGTSCPADPSTASALKQYLCLRTAILLHGNAINPGLERHSDWSSWECFDKLHYSCSAAAEVIPSVSELTKFAEMWRSIMLDQKRLPEAKKIGKSDSYGLAAGRVYPSRQLCLSDNGSLGLAPLSSKVGDQVWVLSGARTPFILRNGHEKDRFRIVGETYMQGFMHGEAVQHSRLQLQRIWLA